MPKPISARDLLARLHRLDAAQRGLRWPLTIDQMVRIIRTLDGDRPTSPVSVSRSAMHLVDTGVLRHIPAVSMEADLWRRDRPARRGNCGPFTYVFVPGPLYYPETRILR